MHRKNGLGHRTVGRSPWVSFACVCGGVQLTAQHPLFYPVAATSAWIRDLTCSRLKMEGQQRVDQLPDMTGRPLILGTGFLSQQQQHKAQ